MTLDEVGRLMGEGSEGLQQLVRAWKAAKEIIDNEASSSSDRTSASVYSFFIAATIRIAAAVMTPLAPAVPDEPEVAPVASPGAAS